MMLGVVVHVERRQEEALNWVANIRDQAVSLAATYVGQVRVIAERSQRIK
jgi:hypothetical protein